MKYHLFYYYFLLLEKHYTFNGCFALLSCLFRSIFVLRQEKCLGFLKYFHLLSAAQTQTLYLSEHWICIQTVAQVLQPIQCKFLSQDLKDEMSFVETLPVQLLVVFFKVIYNYVSDLSLQVSHNTTALYFKLLNANTLVDASQSRQASMDKFCFL